MPCYIIIGCYESFRPETVQYNNECTRTRRTSRDKNRFPFPPARPPYSIRLEWTEIATMRFFDGRTTRILTLKMPRASSSPPSSEIFSLSNFARAIETPASIDVHVLFS